MRNKIFAIVGEVMECSVESLSEETDFTTMENWDSIKSTELVLSLEKAFGVSFDDDDAAAMTNMKATLAKAAEKKSARDARAKE